MLTTRETSGEGVSSKGSPLSNEELDNNFIDLYKLGTYTSTGMIDEPSITDLGSGSVQIAARSVSLYATDDFSGERLVYDLEEATFLLTDGVTTYIVAEYNNGSPIFNAYSDVSIINQSSVVPVFTIFRDGSRICILGWGALSKGLANKLHARLVKTRRFERESGLAISESNIRELNITSGVVWIGGHSVNIAAFNSVANTCYLVTKNNGNWIKEVVTQYPNNAYQDGDNVNTLNNNNFGVIWVFKYVSSTSNILHLLLGTESYSKESYALTSEIPTDIPAFLPSNTILIGRIIVRKNENIATDISSAFTAIFSSAGVSDHENLSNILGGGVEGHYHLTGDELTELTYVTELNTANGFNLQNPDSIGEVTWDNTSMAFTIAPKTGQTSFEYWIDGIKYSSTTSISSSAIPDDETSTYYTYLDELGNLNYIKQSSITQDLFYRYALVSFVYYNHVTDIGNPFKEQHGYQMSSASHEMEHLTIGARYSRGMNPTGLVHGVDTFTGITSGQFFDEDIPHNLVTETTMPFMYRNGIDGGWVWTTPDNKVGYKNGTSNVCWNENTGSGWQLTESGSNTDYMIYFLVAFPSLTDNSYNKIVGQAGYSRAGLARDAIETEKASLILQGLPTPETCFIGAMIVKRSGTLVKLSDGSTFFDLRGTSSRGSGAASVASNLAADIIVDTTNFSKNLSSTDNTLQQALETLDQLTL